MKSDIINFNRIRRTKFLAYTNIVYGFHAFIYYLTFGSSDFSIDAFFSKSPFILITLMILSFFPLKFLAQRFRDSGVSGWWALVGVIPHTFALLYLLLGCFRGENYTNKYGITSNKSGVFLQLLAFLPIVAAISILFWYYFK